jgi:Secretion system C-terminal sorting domain/SprB repeat/Alpha amylase, catalytic domain/Domain of unknown function (DUF1939)
MKKILYIVLFMLPYLVHSQDFMMQAWYWDYPKTTTGANWVGTLQGQASGLNGKFTYMWLPPLAKPSFGNNSNGYDPKDLYDYGEFNNGCPWGNRAGLNSLISTYNSNNIKAVADVVYNHRDGGRAENNPAVENYVTNFSGNGAPYPSDRMRCVLPLGSGTLNGAGDYYIKFSSKTGNTSSYGGKPYKLYVQTKKIGWQNLPDLTENEPNGGGDCSQPFTTAQLGRNIACTTDASGCLTDEFKITLTANDFFATDTLFIYFSNQNGQYSDHRPYGLWSTARSANIISEVKYQTYTDFSGLPSGQGAMNYLSFKPNGINPTNLTGDQDAMYFFYDYEQANSTCQNVLNDWTKWNWNNVGIRGFRMDAVKHFPASYVSQMLNSMNSQGYNPGMIVGESFDFSAGTLKGWVDQVIGGMSSSAKSAINVRAFDFALRGALKSACDGFGYDVRNVYTSGMVEGAGASGFNAVTFVNNHDFRSPGEPVQNDPKLAYAYILTNNRVGVPCVFYPDYYGVSVPNSPTVTLQPQIDQLIAIHKQHIFGSNQLEYLNKEGSGTLNGSNYISSGAGASKTTTQIYQIKGGVSGRDVIVCINYSGQTLKVDHQINTTGNPLGTKFDDLIGNSAFPSAQVDGSGRIYIELPPRSYSVWLRQSGQPASPVSVALNTQTNVSCNGGNNGSATVAATGGSGCTISYLWSNGQTGATANNLTPGTYSVIATCGTQTGSYIVTITQPSAILPVATSSQPVTCTANGSASVTATGGTGAYTYLWTGGYTTPTIGAPTTGIYSVTVTDANNCKKSTQVNVGLNTTPPTAQINSAGGLTCVSNSVVLSNSTTPANYQYLWSNNSTGSSLTVSQAGTYSLTVTDNTNGCKANNNITVSTNTTPPTAQITTVNPILTCANPTQSLAVTSNGTGFDWAGGTIVSGATTTTPIVSAAGTYTVTATGSNGCTTTKSIAVTENKTVPTITATGGTISCAQPTTTINAAATPTGATFAWSGPNAFTSALPNPSVSTGGTYSVTATGANGCKSNASTTVTDNKTVLAPTIQGTNSLCSGASSILEGKTGFTTYKWSNNQTTPNITITAAGTYTLTVTDAMGCTGSVSQVVAAALPPSVIVVNDTLKCNKLNLTLNATTNSTLSATSWTGPNNFTASTLTPSVNTAGVYTLTATSNQGCSAQFVATIYIDQNAPQISITGNSLLCNGGTATLTATPNLGTYLWSNNSTSNILTTTQPGIYSLTVTTATGCKSAASVSVGISPPMNVTLSGKTSCNNLGTIAATVTGGTPNFQYAWNVSNLNLAQIPVGVPSTIIVTITDINGCKSVSQPFNLAAYPTVNVAATIKDATGTNNDGSIDLTLTNGAAPYTFAWSNGITAEDLKKIPAGKYCVTITDVNSCIKTDCFDVKSITNIVENSVSKAITIFPNPVQDFLNITVNGTIQLTKIQVLDEAGRMLQTLKGDVRQIDLRNLPNAVYFIQLQTENETAVKKITKM